MYVVAGVSGNTGRVVAETLLAAGESVRVIIRDATKGDAWRRRGAEVAALDLDDVAALTKALAGTKGAYLLLPPQLSSTDSRADNAARTKRVVAAIEESGVPHVVFLSSIAAHLESGSGPIISVHDAELALRAVKADITIIRAAYFMENWRLSLSAIPQGVLPTFLRADHAIAMVATHDIGTTAAKALVNGGRGKTIIELAGPRDYTPTEVAAALSNVTGRSIKLEVGPDEAIQQAMVGAGMNPHWAGLYAEMTRGLNNGHIAWERAQIVRGATPIESVLKELTRT